MTLAALGLDADLLARGRLTVQVCDSTIVITLDHPATLNSQLPETWEALALIGSRLDESTRAVVVKGAGRAFSSGLDRSAFRMADDSALARVGSAPDAVADELIASFQRGFTWLSDPGFVSVAAVAGHAVGAGFQLALACDLIVAADDAQFCMAEVSHGLVPDLGGSGRLVRAAGERRALEICATGRRVGAAEAVRIGIALAAVPTATLDDAVADLVAALTEQDPETLRAISRLFAGSADRHPAEQLAAERIEQIARIRSIAARGRRARE